jgi:hypothetical protein
MDIITNHPLITLSAIAVLWYASGLISFTYWWTKDYDLTPSILPFAMIAGAMGPAAFVLGCLIHSESSRVLIKRRTPTKPKDHANT